MTLAESNGEVQLVEIGNRRVADQFKPGREWHLREVRTRFEQAAETRVMIQGSLPGESGGVCPCGKREIVWSELLAWREFRTRKQREWQSVP